MEIFMFVYSMKASTLKFIGAITASVAILTAVILLIPTYDSTAASATVKYTGIKTNEDRIAFLSSFGWEAVSAPVEEKQIRIPAEFDRILEKYNNIQLDQGLDLAKYRRKTVMRYTYQITNYPDYDGTVYANLLICRNRVIGGDICSADPQGFVFGFGGK